MEAAMEQVTVGALDAIFNDSAKLDAEFAVPVCQVVQIKELAGGVDGAVRYRLVLSDTKNFVQSMLATQANHVVVDGKLTKGCFVRLKQYQANAVKGKRILIILDLDVIDELGQLEKLGEPTALVAREEENTKPANSAMTGGGFYGNKTAEVKQERSLPSRAGPASSQGGHSNIYPIEGLSPYAHKWTIKARVTSKSDIKTWHKQTSEGKLFSVDLLDESGEIKATGFNEQCDALYDLFTEGGVYYITSPCKVQLAKKQFSRLNNDYELTFERDTIVEKAEVQDDVPQVKYNFSNIADLNNIEKDTIVDCIGVLKEVGEVNELIAKTTQKPYSKRDLSIVDDTGYSVKLTIWGKQAQAFEANPETIIAFKGLKVSDFGGRSLSLLSSGSMSLDPDIQEAHKLKGWYDAQGRTENFNSHSNMSGAGMAGGRQEPAKTVQQVRDENLGMNNEKGDYFDVKGTVVYIKQDNFAYPACQGSPTNDKCAKKVIDVGDGWRCEACQINHETPRYRYVMSISVSDHTGQLWLSCFDDVAQMLMAIDANELVRLKEEDTASMEKKFEAANCQTWLFRCRAQLRTYNEQSNVRYQVMNASPINFVSEAHKLESLIKAFNID